MEGMNKYWLKEKYMFVCYGNGQNCVNNYVEECHKITN